jgi:hypothetical protein
MPFQALSTSAATESGAVHVRELVTNVAQGRMSVIVALVEIAMKIALLIAVIVAPLLLQDHHPPSLKTFSELLQFPIPLTKWQLPFASHHHQHNLPLVHLVNLSSLFVFPPRFALHNTCVIPVSCL